MTMQELAHRLVRPDYAIMASCLVRMKVSVIDELWVRDEYIRHGKFRDDATGNRCHTFLNQERKKKFPFVYSPILFYEQGSVRFEDGNHRFVVLRDAGVASVDVATTATMRMALNDKSLLEAMLWQVWDKQTEIPQKR